jgi:succinyl-diaminopimelate desuccinylase
MRAVKRNEPLDPVELAAELIRRPSVTPKDAGALPLLAGVLEQAGFVCQLQEFGEPGTESVLNLYARCGKSGRNLCFAGHMDVVPPGDLEAWTVPPFTGRSHGDALYGRGATDMKGAIACSPATRRVRAPTARRSCSTGLPPAARHSTPVSSASRPASRRSAT